MVNNVQGKDVNVLVKDNQSVVIISFWFSQAFCAYAKDGVLVDANIVSTTQIDKIKIQCKRKGYPDSFKVTDFDTLGGTAYVLPADSGSGSGITVQEVWSGTPRLVMSNFKAADYSSGKPKHGGKSLEW